MHRLPPADSLTSVVGMTTIAQALDDLIDNHDLPLEIAVDRHFSRVEETTLLLEGAAHDREIWERSLTWRLPKKGVDHAGRTTWFGHRDGR